MAKAKRNELPVVNDPEWHESLSVWRAGIDAGKPDAAAVVRLQIEKLDREASALRIRCSILAQTIGDVESGAAANRLTSLEKDLAKTEAKVGILADLLSQTRMVKDRDEGETPEQAARPYRRYDALEALALTPDQKRAGEDVRKIHEAIARAGNARIGQMDAAGRAPVGVYREPDILDKEAERRHARYLPWWDHLANHNTDAQFLCDKVLIRNIPLDRCRRTLRIGFEPALAKLADALDLYWREWTPLKKPRPIYND